MFNFVVEERLNKHVKKASSGARYLLFTLNLLKTSKFENIIENVTIKMLASFCYLSERSISNHIKELIELEIIDAERDIIFGKGRGVYTYNLYEPFDLKVYDSPYLRLAITRVLDFTDITCMQKFLLCILMGEADNFGRVRALGFSWLSEISGLCPQAIKQNLNQLIEKEFLFSYSSGGNNPLFLRKTKSNFYLNMSACFQLSSNHEQVQRLVSMKKLTTTTFIRPGGIAVSDINNFDGAGPAFKEFWLGLTDHSKNVVLNHLESTLDFCASQLLCIINQKDDKYCRFFEPIKDKIFYRDWRGIIESVNSKECLNDLIFLNGKLFL